MMLKTEGPSVTDVKQQTINAKTGDILERINAGEHPFAAAWRPMKGGSREIRQGHITHLFSELRSFGANALPDFEEHLASLKWTNQDGIPCEVGNYVSVDLEVLPPYPGITESGSLFLTLNQQDQTHTRVEFRPFRLEKQMSVDASSNFGYGERDGGAYVYLSTHGRGWPYREQMVIGATTDAFSGSGHISIAHEYDVIQEGTAPASRIQIRFYDDSDKRTMKDHNIAVYKRQGDKLVLDKREVWYKGVQKMRVQLPQEIPLNGAMGELVMGIPTQIGNGDAIKEKRIVFPEQLSPVNYIEAVKSGTVDSKILGDYRVY